jgi:hypothetical protein
MNVPLRTKEIAATGTPVIGKSTLSANNGKAQNLNVGPNVLKITVTSEDGATVKTYTVNVTRYNLEIPMVSVPAGSFQRTSNAGAVSKVSAFMIGSREITREQFYAVMGTDPSDREFSTYRDPAQNVQLYRRSLLQQTEPQRGVKSRQRYKESTSRHSPGKTYEGTRCDVDSATVT